MRALCLCLSWFILCSLLLGGQADTAIPPGLRKADKLPNPADDAPLLAPQPRAVDPARLKREADELAKLAQSIPPQIDRVTSGQLPKELNTQLKRIEKLAKRLRHDLSP